MATTPIDPTSLSQQLATAYTQNARTLLTTQTTAATATGTGLTQLQSALQAFDSAVTAMSDNKSVLARSAALSDTSLGSATADSTAIPGSYAFFVEQLASTHRLAVASLPTVAAAGAGTLGIHLADGSNLTVNLAAADQDNDGTLSPTELARAINQATGNPGTVTASLVTSGGQTRLLLTSAKSGAAGQITLDTSAIGAAALKAALDTPTQLSAAQDAVLWLGDQGTGLRIQQASNTFTGIDGVSVQFSQAMATGAAPVTLTVAADDSGTAANVKTFVDAYNALEKALDSLTQTANADTNTTAGAFANDASVRALRSRLANSVRMAVGGVRLADFGVSIDKTGTMSLDATKLASGLAAHPDGLDALLGHAGLTGASGIFGAVDTAMTAWTRSGNGQIQQRQNSLQILQKSLADRSTRLDDQYTQLYNRYLAQFTQLQALQASMSQTGDLFSNLTTTS